MPLLMTMTACDSCRKKKVRCEALPDHKLVQLASHEHAYTDDTDTGALEPLSQPPCANCCKSKGECVFSRLAPKRESGRQCVSHLKLGIERRR